MEGARWDWKNHVVAHSNPKELFITMPMILLVPAPNR